MCVDKLKARTELGIKQKYVILCTGGSLGAEKINNAVIEIVEKLLQGREDIYFVNPCVEHLFLTVKELNNSGFRTKKDYQPFFAKYYGVNDYAGHLPQVEEMIEKITYQDYLNFMDNLRKMSEDDNDMPSSNFLRFINFIKK